MRQKSQSCDDLELYGMACQKYKAVIKEKTSEHTEK
jgi:hypothetical protein